MATAPPSADAALVRRLRERDRTAWEELYAEFAPRLRPFAYRLTGSVHDADDLVQETFVRALPRLDRLDPERVEVGPYLFTTLRNLFLKSVERRKRAEPVADVPEPTTPAPIEDDPERNTLLHRQQEEVRIANARLAPRQRLVLALRELEDRSYAEIGVVVGLNENAVAQLISRARESLRTELRLAQVDPERLPEECRANLPMLSRHLDGQLRGAQLEQTLAHLDGCERCQNALLEMREAQRRYRTLLPPFGDDDAHAARIEADLTSAGYWDGPRRLPRLRGRRAVVAASVALLAVGGGGVGAAVLATGRSPAPLPDVPSATQVAASSSATTEARTTTAPQPPATERARSTTAPVAATTARPLAVTQLPKPKPKPTTNGVGGATTTTETVATTTPATTKPAPVEPGTTEAPDTTAPTVAITARPQARTASSDASFSFHASEAGSTFTCSLDRGDYAPCTSPAAFRELPPGAHSLAVRARDRAGNTGPATVATWTILEPPDETPPTATIVTAAIRGSDATFEFTSSEPGSTFGCSLDGGAFESCTSPRAYSRLAPGAHTFAVRATDAAGNTGAPAAHSWMIARPLPDLVLTALAETSFTVTNTGTAAAGPFVVSVTLIGTFSIPGLAAGQSVTRVWSACRRGTLTAIADRGRTVAESNEDNNTRALVSDC